MAAIMEAAIFIMFNMHAYVCACACTCMHAHVHVCMHGGCPTQPTPPNHPPTPQGGYPPNQLKRNKTWTNWDSSILLKDLESVENSPPMGGCFFWWVGGWMGGLVGQNMWNHKNFNKTWSNQDNWILFEDLWFVDTLAPLDRCMGGWLGWSVGRFTSNH